MAPEITPENCWASSYVREGIRKLRQELEYARPERPICTCGADDVHDPLHVADCPAAVLGGEG